MTSRSRIGAAALLAGVIAAALATLAACGGGGGGGSSAAPAQSASGVQAELAAYVSCLNHNGVTITLPSGGPGGFGGVRPSGSFTRPTDRPTGDFPTARPAGSGRPGGFGGGFLQKPSDVDQATWDKALSACSSLRPSFGGGAGRGGAGNGAVAAYLNCLRDHGSSAGNPSADAEKACAVLKPTTTPSS